MADEKGDESASSGHHASKIRELLFLAESMRDLGPYSEAFILRKRLTEILRSSDHSSQNLDEIENCIRWHAAMS